MHQILYLPIELHWPYMSTTGVLTKGQKIELLGYGRSMKSVVSDIQVFKRSVPSATAGENVGVLLRGVKPEFIERSVA